MKLPFKEISLLPVTKTIDFCLRLLATLIKAVRINRVWNEEDKVYKCRRWWGWVLILIGNPVLACRRVPVRVLSTTQWVLWEREVKLVISGENVPSGRVLICNQLSGVPLADWLIKSDETKALRLEALRIALEGLQVFHAHQVDDSRGNSIPLSHGDATLNNVLYNATDNKVQWIDFDVRHWLHLSASQRHADDLRAFLFSAARHLSQDELPEFLSIAQKQYDDRAAWDHLRDQLASHWFRFDVFHRAQIRRGPSAGDSAREINERFSLLWELICR